MYFLFYFICPNGFCIFVFLEVTVRIKEQYLKFSPKLRVHSNFIFFFSFSLRSHEKGWLVFNLYEACFFFKSLLFSSYSWALRLPAQNGTQEQTEGCTPTTCAGRHGCPSQNCWERGGDGSWGPWHSVRMLRHPMTVCVAKWVWCHHRVSTPHVIPPLWQEPVPPLLL